MMLVYDLFLLFKWTSQMTLNRAANHLCLRHWRGKTFRLKYIFLAGKIIEGKERGDETPGISLSWIYAKSLS